MRILGIDYGTKRIGIAVSDALGIAAHSRGYLPAGQSLITALQTLIASETVTHVVIGHPKDMRGGATAMTLEVEAFAQQLGQHIACPIELWDERMTSAQTERILIDANVRRAKRKEIQDGLAATLILQSYLDSKACPLKV